MPLKEDEVVMCTVKSIEGTTVFVHIEGDGEGTLMMSEVAAGRIRNLREYVAPNKKIVCKVLKISQDHVQLSLRRVTAKEKEEIRERFKKENILFSMLNAAVPNAKEIAEKIKQTQPLWEFFDQVKANPSHAEKYLDKPQAQALLKIIEEKREKDKIVKRELTIHSNSEDGIQDIKYSLSVPGVKIHYLGSSRFSLSTTAPDFKDANLKLQSALAEISKRAKERKLLLEVKEK